MLIAPCQPVSCGVIRCQVLLVSVSTHTHGAYKAACSNIALAVTSLKMETHTRALELVCSHFRNEFSTQEIASLRKRLNCAHVQNHRLRKKALQHGARGNSSELLHES